MDKRDPQQKSSLTASRYLSEPALQTAIVQTLRANGLSIDEQVRCATGAADLVTTHRDTIFEVKLWLSRKALQQAVGQLLLYRQAINPNARIVIVGYATTETAALRPHVEALGIEVVCWQDQSEITHWVPKDATYSTCRVLRLSNAGADLNCVAEGAQLS